MFAVAVTGALIVGGSSLWALRQSLLKIREAQIEDMVLSARNLVAGYAIQQTEGKLTQEQAQAQALEPLFQLRVGKTVSMFVGSPDGLMLSHPNSGVKGTVSRRRTSDGRLDSDVRKEAMRPNGVSIIRIAVKKPGDATTSDKLTGIVEFPQ